MNQITASWVQTRALAHRIDASYYTPDALERAQWIMDWQGNTTPVEAISSLVTDGTHATPNYKPEGVPFLSATNIDCCVINLGKGHKFVSESAHRQLQQGKCSPLKGDVLVSKSGRIGTAATNHLPFEYSVFESVAIVRISDTTDPDFVTAFLNSEPGVSQIERLQKGAVQKHLHLEELRELRIAKVSPGLQRAIGNKIRKAERLRELAAAKWDEAFAALEASLGQSLSAAEFNALDANKLSRAGYQCTSVSPATVYVSVDDEIGAQYFHPRRERARQVASQSVSWQLLTAVARRIKKKGRRKGFLGLDRIDSRTGIVSPTSSDLVADGVMFESDDILFSRLRPYLNKVTFASTPHGVGSPELLVYRAINIDPQYLYFVLKSPLGLYQVVDVTSGSTHPRVDADVVDGIRVPRIPPKDEDRIGDAVRSAFANWASAPLLIDVARMDVEAVIEGTLDKAALLAEGEAIEEWLADNPSPHSK